MIKNKLIGIVLTIIIFSIIISIILILNNNNANQELYNEEINVNVVNDEQKLDELDEIQKEELFARVKNVAFLQELVRVTDNEPKFSDKEIIELLTVLDVDNTFKIDEYVDKYAVEEDIQSLALKYFGRTIDLKNINSKMVEHKNDAYYISFSTGYGIVLYSLNYIKTVGINEYDISIKYTDYDSMFLGNYILTVEYHDDTLIYKAFREEV